MKINTNVSSLTAQEAATNTNNSIKNSLEKLSTGLKINKASDDASGLAIADKLRTQVTSINQGIANGNSAVALLQIADKSMAEQSNILDTIKAKLIQANTDTTSTAGRTAIAKDVSKLLEQLDNIAAQTNYNGTYLLQAGQLSSGPKSALSFQIGETTNDMITTASIQANTSGYALTTLVSDVATASLFDRSMAQAGQAAVDAAITQLNSYRGDIGST
uniref:flagellin N-terminal helical domain-containing protein n=1 Tax=Aliarcobacter skirrowii TaxID=28200 RepID=UPI00082AD800